MMKRFLLLSVILIAGIGPSSALRGSSSVNKIPEPTQRDVQALNDDEILKALAALSNNQLNRVTSTPAPTPACVFNPNSFNDNVIVEYVGNAAGVTDSERRKLEEVFVQSYMDATEPYCDLKFRQIWNATILEQSTSPDVNARKLYSTVPGSTKVTRKFSYRFFVVGTCRSCSKDSTLCDDAIGRRAQTYHLNRDANTGSIKKLNSLQWGTVTGGYNIQRAQDRPSIFESVTLVPAPTPPTLRSQRSCVCKNPVAPNRAPTQRSFAIAMDKRVRALNLTNVESVVTVTEVNEIPCDSSLGNFQTSVVINSQGDPTMITQDELNLLGDTFVTNYNTLAYQSCDPKFRLATAAQFTVETTNTANRSGRHLQRKYIPFRFRVAVSGVCKSCSKDSLCFDDTSNRRLEEFPYELEMPFEVEVPNEMEVPPFMEPNHRKLGFVLGNGTCFCSTVAPPKSPQVAQFTVVFNNSVTALAKAGNITHVQAIESTIQVNEALPSAAPSSAPTRSPAPSLSPSNVPTTHTPTQNPTSKPTKVPTFSPTFPPSFFPSSTPSTDQPTEMPHPTESPKPSPSPSLQPSLKP